MQTNESLSVVNRLTTPFKIYTQWLHTAWPAGTVEKLPEANENGITNIPGVRIVGDLTGIPLLKFAVDSGARAVSEMVDAGDFKDRQDDRIDLAIIGAGVSGISAAIEAKKHHLSCVVFEAKQPFATVVDFPKQKPIYTYPTDMTPAGDFTVSADVKESLLDEMEQQRNKADIDPIDARIERIESKGDMLILHHSDGQTTAARRVIVAIGRSGNFRKLGVPGEEMDKVFNRLHDPREFAGKNVLVVGGGDSALEAAIALATSGAHVVLSYRKKDFSRPKQENLAKLNELEQNPAAHVMVEHPTSERVTTAAGYRLRGEGALGSVRLALGTTVKDIREQAVELEEESGERKTIFNDVVFTMIGREAPLEFFRRSGIPIVGETRLKGWMWLAIFILFLIFLYSWKSGGPTETWLDPWPGNMPQVVSSMGDWFDAKVNDRSTVIGTIAISLKSRSFYYTLIYSLCIILFGIARIKRRKTPYVTYQTLALMAVQVFPLFLIPEIILPLMGYNGLFSSGVGRTIADNLFELYISEADYLAGVWPDWGHPRAYWRAYGFILAWPLNVYNVFTDHPKTWWLVISFVQTFVIIPALIYRYGKGVYCGWICSCGALAETMGDQQRHKMPHGPFWNRLNMAGQVILGVAFLLLLIRIGGWIFPDSWMAKHFLFLLEGKNSNYQLVNFFSYKWVVDILLGGILGVGLYFKYSGRVWCRFFCPLAALMHIYARFSKFRIFADKKKCISCNVCTSVCHQGIDIMNFANKGLPMEDPECVRCSACVQSCPTGVLTFGRFGKNETVIVDSLPASLVQMVEKGK